MRGLIDFSSWQTILATLLSLLVASLLMVGIRLVFMQTIQKRRERENRQINERLKTLIAAYKTLGGSFTGELQVSPLHLRDLVRATRDTLPTMQEVESLYDEEVDGVSANTGNERQRRIRDAVEAALSDVILLGTEAQVALAAKAAQDMAEGRSIETASLVVSLRNFIREALDLEPIPESLRIPNQGPVRPNAPAGGRGPNGANGPNAVRPGATGNQGAGRGGAGGGTGGGGMGMGVAMGGGAGAYAAKPDSDTP